eukprot:1814988-Alexandrium_andersonii.AAC.1
MADRVAEVATQWVRLEREARKEALAKAEPGKGIALQRALRLLRAPAPARLGVMQVGGVLTTDVDAIDAELQ